MSEPTNRLQNTQQQQQQQQPYLLYLEQERNLSPDDQLGRMQLMAQSLWGDGKYKVVTKVEPPTWESREFFIRAFLVKDFGTHWSQPALFTFGNASFQEAWNDLERELCLMTDLRVQNLNFLDAARRASHPIPQANAAPIRALGASEAAVIASAAIQMAEGADSSSVDPASSSADPASSSAEPASSSADAASSPIVTKPAKRGRKPGAPRKSRVNKATNKNTE